MRARTFHPIGFFLVLLCGLAFQGFSTAYSQTDNNIGIQPLLEPNGKSIHHFIPEAIQPLIYPQEIEHFLQKLEGSPPDWMKLRRTNITEQSERLFTFNRQRDTARADKYPALQGPVAFLWAGLLRQYIPDVQGFSIALGPELIKTSWGIVRFKPVDLPDYLVAVPPPDVRTHISAKQKSHEQIEVVVVCIGTLITDESLIYGFSHDGDHEGMILPVVSIQKMMFILKPA